MIETCYFCTHYDEIDEREGKCSAPTPMWCKSSIDAKEFFVSPDDYAGACECYSKRLDVEE